jgi:hypothetical protein
MNKSCRGLFDDIILTKICLFLSFVESKHVPDLDFISRASQHYKDKESNVFSLIHRYATQPGPFKLHQLQICNI